MADWWESAANEVGELAKQGALEDAAPPPPPTADGGSDDTDWWHDPTPPSHSSAAEASIAPSDRRSSIPETGERMSVKVRLAQRRQQGGKVATDTSSFMLELAKHRRQKQLAPPNGMQPPPSSLSSAPREVLPPAGAPPRPTELSTLKEAVRLSGQQHGLSAVVTGQAWHRLADATVRTDRHAALFCYSKVTQTLQHAADPASRLEASSAAVKFAKLCCGDRRYGAAAPAFRMALQIRRQVLGNSHPGLAEPALELAEILHSHLDRSNEAAMLAAVVLRILEDNKCEDSALIDKVARMRAEIAEIASTASSKLLADTTESRGNE